MVKLYLNKETEEGKISYIDVRLSSILKAYVVGWISFLILIFGGVIILGLILNMIL